MGTQVYPHRRTNHSATWLVLSGEMLGLLGQIPRRHKRLPVHHQVAPSPHGNAAPSQTAIASALGIFWEALKLGPAMQASGHCCQNQSCWTGGRSVLSVLCPPCALQGRRVCLRASYPLSAWLPDATHCWDSDSGGDNLPAKAFAFSYSPFAMFQPFF